jgi:hypothetical protein
MPSSLISFEGVTHDINMGKKIVSFNASFLNEKMSKEKGTVKKNRICKNSTSKRKN